MSGIEGLSSPLQREALEGVEKALEKEPSAAPGIPDNVVPTVNWNAARMAASGQAHQLAQMARLLDAEDKMKAGGAGGGDAPISSAISSVRASSAQAAGVKGAKGKKTEVKPRDLEPAEAEAWLKEVATPKDWQKYQLTTKDRENLTTLAKMKPEEMKSTLAKLSPEAREKVRNLAFLHGGEKSPVMWAAAELGQLGNKERDEMTYDYVRGLAELPEDELRAWHDNATPEELKLLQDRINIEGHLIFPGESEGKGVALSDKLQGFLVEQNARWASKHFKGLSEAEIQKQIKEELATPEGAKHVAEQLQYLAVGTDNKTYEKYLSAMQKATLSFFGKGVGDTHLTQIAIASAELSGPGSAAAKGRMIATLQERMGDRAPKNVIASILKSDPRGTITFLEGLEEKDSKYKGVLNKAITGIITQYGKDDYQKGLDEMAEILSPFASDLAMEANADPFVLENFQSASRMMGYAVGLAENAFDSLSNADKAKIDRGKFILDFFAKGVATITGIKAIETVGKKITGALADYEKKGVDEKREAIIDAMNMLVQTTYNARGPNVAEGNDKADKSRVRQNNYETQFTDGFDEARKQGPKRK